MADRVTTLLRTLVVATVLCLLGLVDSARGQGAPLRPLPPTQYAPFAEPLQGRLASTPYLTEPIDIDRLPLVEEYFIDSQVIVEASSTQDGIFQGSTFTGTWLATPSGNDLGMSDLYLDAKFGFPMPTRESPLIVTPAFGTTFLDGPTTPDLPARVYDATLEFRWLRRLNERWAMDVAVQPGVHSDFQSSQSESLRIAGRGMGIFDWTPFTKIVLGVVYLDRRDVSLLPAAGLIWTPNDDWRFELVAPRPRIARRFRQCAGSECVEHWAYVAGEFGGGEWAIRRAGGADDVATARDYRLILGVERKVIGGLSSRFEIAYVFGRELEYASATPDFEPDDTLMVRMGLSY